MRIITALICTLCLSIGLSAQSDAISKHYQDYADRDDVTSISVSGILFQLAQYIEIEEGDVDGEEFKDFITSIDAFHMIVGDDAQFKRADFKQAINRSEREYEELMTIEDKDGDFNFRIKEKNGVVQEFLMIAMAEEDLIIMTLTGRMDLAQLSRMGSKLQTGSTDYFSKLDETTVEELKIYPNPAPADSQVTIEVPESLVGGQATIYDLNGRQVMTYPMGARKQRVGTSGLSAGRYVIEFVEGGRTVSRKIEVQ